MMSNTDPVILDGSGRAAIYITDLAYKFVLETPIPTGMTHGTTIWTVDNIVDTGLIALNASGGAISTANINYVPPFSGSVALNLGTYLLSERIDIRNFGAVGYTGNCHSLSADDQPYIQAALNYAAATGPAEVFIPGGYCWPVQTHLWVPSNVRLVGAGATTGYEVSSPGSLIIANNNWSTANVAGFPYSQMIWVTGTNSTSGTFTPNTANTGSSVSNLEINCNDSTNCGNVLAVGRQQGTSIHGVALTGTRTAEIAFFEEGSLCFGSSEANCLITAASAAGLSQNQGPDYNINIQPGTSGDSTTRLFIEAGALGYRGLQDSMIGGTSSITVANAIQFWGNSSQFGPGINSPYATVSLLLGGTAGESPACPGDSTDLISGFSGTTTILNCTAQNSLTFTGMTGTITNSQSGAPVGSISDTNYFYDSATQSSGYLGSLSPTYTKQSILMQDPATYVHNGFGGLNFFSNGTTLSGLNASSLLTDTNAANTRAHVSSNAWWNHSTGAWNLGGNGGTDYGSLGFIPGGTCISTGTSVSSPFTMATWLGNCAATVSDTGHLLVGAGWINTSTGATQGEGSNALQVAGDIGSGSINPGPQMGQSSATTCPTSSASGATCTFSVVWGVAYANSTYPVVCSLLDGTGFPGIKGVSRTTTGVTVTIQNVGAGSLAVASGGSGVACWAQP